jgi:hypothetical protein
MSIVSTSNEKCQHVPKVEVDTVLIRKDNFRPFEMTSFSPP